MRELRELLVICSKCNKASSFQIKSPYEDKIDKLSCFNCNAPFEQVQFHQAKGVVYVLSNPSMPNLLKIGQTTRPIEERVNELSRATGVPEKFVIEASFRSHNPKFDEKVAHRALKRYRHSDKEFFRVDLGEALNILVNVFGRQPSSSRSKISLKAQTQTKATPIPQAQTQTEPTLKSQPQPQPLHNSQDSWMALTEAKTTPKAQPEAQPRRNEQDGGRVLTHATPTSIPKAQTEATPIPKAQPQAQTQTKTTPKAQSLRNLPDSLQAVVFGLVALVASLVAIFVIAWIMQPSEEAKAQKPKEQVEGIENLLKKQVEIVVKYDTRNCSSDYPLLITIHNKSNKTVVKVSWRVGVYKPESFRNLADYPYPDHTSDKIFHSLKPGERHRSCWSLAWPKELKYIGDYAELEYRITDKSVTFEN